MEPSTFAYEQFERDDDDNSTTTKGTGAALQGWKKIACKVSFLVITGVVILIVIIVAAIVSRNGTSKEPAPAPEPAPGPEAYKNRTIRLPDNVVPLKYRIYLHPNITDGNSGFSGDTKILVKIKSPTDKIILHSRNLSIIKTIVHIAANRDLELADDFPEVAVVRVEEYKEDEQLVIQFDKELAAEEEYVVHIVYNAAFASTFYGFFKTSYTTNDEKRYLATSFFEATGARQVFPCFDEPAMKAEFTIIIVREKNYTALSNMPVERSVPASEGALVTDYFRESVRMSTYLVAFIICDFAYLNTTTKGGVEVKVWAPVEQINQGHFALETASKILDYYGKFFNVSFPLPKLDLVPITGFGYGGMENWGLNSFAPSCLLFDEKEDSSSAKQRIVTVLAHELGHQWFGNLVTMHWWSDLWLNEGFASFVEYIGADVLFPSWKIMDQFLELDMEEAMTLDAYFDSHPISLPVRDPDQINELFDPISYQKGSSLIRMMEDFLGTEVFHNGLANYLSKYKYGNAYDDDLWLSMTKAHGGTLNVKNIMDTWTLQMGYPVVTVARQPDNKNVAIATQKRFITDVKNVDKKPPGRKNVVKSKENRRKPNVNRKPKPRPQWDIPLTYYFENEKKERKWFHSNKENVDIPWKNTSRWLKVNVDQIGFYRVNYDKENWDALTSQLNEDHTVFSDADRSNLIHDAFALARAGFISTSQALNLTTYLKNETQYVPYSTALGSLGYIGGRLRHRAGYKFYEKYIVQTILPRVEDLGWEDTGTHLDKYLRKDVLASVVYHNETDAVKKTKQMFDEWMRNGTRIPVSLRYIVYKVGIKYGGRKEWDFMFEKFKVAKAPAGKRLLMKALCSTTDAEILKQYLELSLDENVISKGDFIKVIQIIAGNIAGTKLAVQFLKENWNIVVQRYARVPVNMAILIRGVFSMLQTKKDLADAKNFLSTHELGTGKLAAKQVLVTIGNQVTWLEKNENEVVTWFKRNIV